MLRACPQYQESPENAWLYSRPSQALCRAALVERKPARRGLVQELTDAQAASVYAGGRVALDDLFDEFARDHEGDAALARIGALHRVHVAEARRAAMEAL